MDTNNNLYPIAFSIPENKIVNEIPNKTKIIAMINPHGVGNNSYIFQSEIDYYNDYKCSLFAITRKKGGWDCMRHYEILACGCIPVFENLQQCPKNTMFNFPKNIIINTNNFYKYLLNKYGSNKIQSNNISIIEKKDMETYYNFVFILLKYTRENLTTTKMAEYILKNTCETAKKILYISNPVDGDYLRCLTLHGFKKIFKKNCNDYPFLGHIYNSCSENSWIDKTILHGKGFTYTNLIDKDEYHDFEEENNTIENIKNKKYDLIIYSSLHKDKPLFDIVNENYDTNKIVFLCGEDIHYCICKEYCDKGYKVFVREM